MKIYKQLLYITLFGLVFLKSSVSYLIITSFPKLEDIFLLSNLQLGIIISVYYLFSVTFLFLWIYLFGKYSRVKIFFLSSSIWIIGCILFSFSQNFMHLVIYAAVIGFSIEASVVYILLILFQLSPDQKQGKFLALFMIIQGAGSLFGVILTAFFEDILGYSWNHVFLFVGVISLIWLIATAVFILKSDSFSKKFKPDLEKLGYDLNFTLIRDSLKRKTNFNLIIMLLYITPFMFLLNTWVQKYLQDFHSLSQIDAAISYIFLTGGEFLGLIFGGLLFDKFHSRDNYNKLYIAIISLILAIPILFIGFQITWESHLNSSDLGIIERALGLFNFAISNPTISSSYILLFIGFALFGMLYPLFFMIINDCNYPSEKGAMLGVKNIGEILGQAISPIIGGIVADSFSILTLMLLIPIFLIIPLIHLIAIRKLIERDFISINKDQTDAI